MMAYMLLFLVCFQSSLNLEGRLHFISPVAIIVVRQGDSTFSTQNHLIVNEFGTFGDFGRETSDRLLRNILHGDSPKSEIRVAIHFLGRKPRIEAIASAARRIARAIDLTRRTMIIVHIPEEWPFCPPYRTGVGIPRQ